MQGFDLPSQKWAAQVALLALHVAADASPSDGEAIEFEGMGRVTAAQTLSLLSDLPKPVGCSGQFSAGVLKIRCQPITQPLLLSMQVDRDARFEKVLAAFGKPDADPPVLVYGGGQTLLVPLSALHSFVRDYRIICWLAFDDPDHEALRVGATATVHIGRAGQATMFGSPPNVTWIFGAPQRARPLE